MGRKSIPYARHSLDERDIRSVVKVLRSGFITQGPVVGEFEKAVAKSCGAKYAVAVSSGTAALHLACLAAGLKAGDEVVTSPITFVASANAVLYAGATPVFADVAPGIPNIDPGQIEAKITSNTRALIPVDFAGYPYEHARIHEIARRRGLLVIEDGCHALGAQYRVNSKWHRVGSCAHADVCIFSFHPAKAITTGEGGMLTTNNRDLYERLLDLRTHGIVKDAARFRPLPEKSRQTEKPGGWYYEMQSLGFNYRITDFQCALGLSQLKRLDAFIAGRREIARIYDQAFKNFPLTGSLKPSADQKSAYHLYVLQLNLENLTAGRAEIFAAMRSHGLGVQVHYIPIPEQPYYRGMGYGAERFPAAERYYERAMSLPLFPQMLPAEIRRVIHIVQKILRRFTK